MTVRYTRTERNRSPRGPPRAQRPCRRRRAGPRAPVPGPFCVNSYWYVSLFIVLTMFVCWFVCLFIDLCCCCCCVMLFHVTLCCSGARSIWGASIVRRREFRARGSVGAEPGRACAYHPPCPTTQTGFLT